MQQSRRLQVALVGGPMYDGLYTRLPEFERRTGIAVDIGFQGTHPELNAHIAQAYQGGAGPYDLISSHSKYFPSQQHFLKPLDQYLSPDDLAGFLPASPDLHRLGGQLFELSRNIDVRLLYCRTDLLEDLAEQRAFRKRFEGFVDTRGYGESHLEAGDDA